MIVAEFVLLEPQEDTLKATILATHEFNTDTRWNKQVTDWFKTNMANLDTQYHFADWDNCPAIEARYWKEGRLIEAVNCLDYYYSTH